MKKVTKSQRGEEYPTNNKKKAYRESKRRGISYKQYKEGLQRVKEERNILQTIQRRVIKSQGGEEYPTNNTTKGYKESKRRGIS
jgi:hypothetical protein